MVIWKYSLPCTTSMQLMNIQQYDVQIYYTEFNQNYAINVTCMTRNSFMTLTKEWISLQPIFKKITAILWTSHCTEFYKNNKTGEYWKYRHNFTYAIKWNMAFSMLIFTKHIAADQHGGLLDKNLPKLAKKCGILFIKNKSLYWVTCCLLDNFL